MAIGPVRKCNHFGSGMDRWLLDLRLGVTLGLKLFMGQLIKGITSSIPSFASCTSQKSKQTKLLPTNHQHHFHPTRKHHQPTLIFIHFWKYLFQNKIFHISKWVFWNTFSDYFFLFCNTYYGIWNLIPE